MCVRVLEKDTQGLNILDRTSILLSIKTRYLLNVTA